MTKDVTDVIVDLVGCLLDRRETGDNCWANRVTVCSEPANMLAYFQPKKSRHEIEISCYDHARMCKCLVVKVVEIKTGLLVNLDD